MNSHSARKKVMEKRGSGILLHISSLPSRFGIGDLGPGAFKFVDFLSQAKQTVWQILPLSPTDAINNHSPYSSISAFAANNLFISPELLVKDGFLSEDDIRGAELSSERVDYNQVSSRKGYIFDKAFDNFRNSKEKSGYKKFCAKNSDWLEDFALFVALKEYYNGRVWSDWPVDLRDRDKDCLKQVRSELAEKIEKEKFLQYTFFKQWMALKDYCNKRDIAIIGDIPIYVNYDSSDVWQGPQNFKLDKNRKPEFVAGVPPDYFCKTGQRWGNPVFRWSQMKSDKFSWWLKRVKHNLALFDLLRIDHFRGFVAYWEIPASAESAVKGKWVKAPAEDFFKVLLKNFPGSSFIAEDLGLITEDVKKIIKEFGFSGMKVLMFAFGEENPAHPYLPHNYIENCVVYTGTHDNNTTRGWFESEADAQSKKRLFRYMGFESEPSRINWDFIRLAMMSVAKFSITPMQDILGLNGAARMNLPSTSSGNWGWRLFADQLTPDIANRTSEMTRMYARSPNPDDK